jgi:hypothetical protein
LSEIHLRAQSAFLRMHGTKRLALFACWSRKLHRLDLDTITRVYQRG